MSFVLDLTRGDARVRQVVFVHGQARPILSVGTAAAWSLMADDLEEVHAFINFDGESLMVRSAEEHIVVHLDGRPVPATWTPVGGASVLSLGQARIAITATGGAAARAGEGARADADEAAAHAHAHARPEEARPAPLAAAAAADESDDGAGASAPESVNDEAATGQFFARTDETPAGFSTEEVAAARPFVRKPAAGSLPSAPPPAPQPTPHLAPRVRSSSPAPVLVGDDEATDALDLGVLKKQQALRPLRPPGHAPMPEANAANGALDGVNGPPEDEDGNEDRLYGQEQDSAGPDPSVRPFGGGRMSMSASSDPPSSFRPLTAGEHPAAIFSSPGPFLGPLASDAGRADVTGPIGASPVATLEGLPLERPALQPALQMPSAKRRVPAWVIPAWAAAIAALVAYYAWFRIHRNDADALHYEQLAHSSAPATAALPDGGMPTVNPGIDPAAASAQPMIDHHENVLPTATLPHNGVLDGGANAPAVGANGGLATMQRAAADAVAEGDLPRAIVYYEQLAASAPDVRAYGDAARILKAQLVADAGAPRF